MANTQKKEKSYAIKIPVYSSELMKSSNGPLFEGATYEDMIKIVRKKIDAFQESRPKISKEQPHKAKTTEIDSIKYIDTIIGEVPAILIQISAYNTNLLDGYVETEKKITLQQNHKLGSETNFVLLYPRIIGLDTKDYKYQWLILIYEDPHKENVELVSTIKLALKKVLNISTANIKLPTLLDQLRKRGTIPELNLKFSSIINDENEVDVKLRSYLVKSFLLE
ncbi:MAG: hypothetical protein H7259_09870 [Cytophagales bacterium]|nr:hypothetical protein [Cytophaga sp.]